MKVGLQFEFWSPEPGISVSRRFDEMFSLIVHGQDNGYDGVWISERHFTNSGSAPNPLMLLARASEIAPSLRLGTALLALPLWHPIRLAEDIATLDVMSAGRVELGIACESRDREPSSCRRDTIVSDRFDESVAIMLKAFAKDGFSHRGRFWNLPETSVVPKPLQRPHPPIWTAMTDPGSARSAVARGYHVTAGASEPLEQLAERHRMIDAVARQLGRAVDQVQRAVSRFVFCSEDPREIREAIERSRWQMSTAPTAASHRGPTRRKAGALLDEDLLYGESWQRCTIIGDPDECVQRLRALAVAGTSYLRAQFSFGGLDPSVSRRSAERFSRDVMPMVTGLQTTYSDP